MHYELKNCPDTWRIKRQYISRIFRTVVKQIQVYLPCHFYGAYKRSTTRVQIELGFRSRCILRSAVGASAISPRTLERIDFRRFSLATDETGEKRSIRSRRTLSPPGNSDRTVRLTDIQVSLRPAKLFRPNYFYQYYYLYYAASKPASYPKHNVDCSDAKYYNVSLLVYTAIHRSVYVDVDYKFCLSVLYSIYFFKRVNSIVSSTGIRF